MIGVVGAGTMGAGIAYTAALHGYSVRCIDADPGVVQKAIAGLREMADKRVAQGKMSHQQQGEVFGRLLTAANIAELRDSDFVIEAIVEDAAVKRKLFMELDRLCPP